MVRTSGQDAPWMCSCGGIQACPSGRKPQGRLRMPERLYLLAGLEHLGVSPRGVGWSGLGEEHLDLPAKTVAPVTRTQLSARKQKKSYAIDGMEKQF